MNVKGIRGAITCKQNTVEDILLASKELMQTIISFNHLNQEDIAAILFTTTSDLTAAYPARAVRDMGWTISPILCFQEMDVDDSLEKCIRVLILWNTDKTSDQIRHVYLRKACQLRPDLVI
jgi:chorismate mutase